MGFEKKDCQRGSRADSQFRVPSSETTGGAVFAVPSSIEATELCKAIANSSQVTEKLPYNVSSAGRIWYSFWNKSEFF